MWPENCCIILFNRLTHCNSVLNQTDSPSLPFIAVLLIHTCPRLSCLQGCSFIPGQATWAGGTIFERWPRSTETYNWAANKYKMCCGSTPEITVQRLPVGRHQFRVQWEIKLKWYFSHLNGHMDSCDVNIVICPQSTFSQKCSSVPLDVVRTHWQTAMNMSVYVDIQYSIVLAEHIPPLIITIHYFVVTLLSCSQISSIILFLSQYHNLNDEQTYTNKTKLSQKSRIFPFNWFSHN